MNCEKCIFSEIFLRDFENKKANLAIVSDKRSLTYGELVNEIYLAQASYEKCGIAKGTRVVVFMENSPEFTVAFMALNLCEAVIIPIYVKLGSEKLSNILRFYEPSFIVTNSFNFENLNQVTRTYGSFVKKVLIHDEKGDIEVINVDGKEAIVPINDSVAIILSSSGTTSDPKGIMLTNDNIISNTSSIASYMGIEGKDRIFMVKSINHSSSITGELLVGLYAGCSIYIHSGIMHPRLLLDSMQKNKISVFFAVPSILNDLTKCKNIKDFDLQSLRIIHFYGAVMNGSDMDALFETFPKCEMIYSYGLTEASPRVTYAKRDRLMKFSGTSGIALPSVSVRVEYGVDEKTGSNEGEIVVKGPNVMCGYFKRPDLTQKVLRNDELYTGDLGHVDEYGNLYVMGRKDNMIIKNGRNVFPEEIEKIIAALDEVAEVLVSEKNEKIVAYVVPSLESINDKKLIAFCRENLEDYKVPDKIVKVQELKKNANNKLIRNIEY